MIGQNADMNIAHLLRRFALPALALLLVSCAGGAGPGWTYAPLGPTPSAAPSASASPAGSGGPGTSIDIETTAADPLVFSPNEITVPAGATVTVNYLNNSNLPHNINFFDGQDQSAPSLGASKIATGPNAPESVTFTAPTQPGDYFFWCDVHQAAMVGTYHVQ